MFIYFKRGKRSMKPFTAFALHHFYTGGLVTLLCFWFGFELYMPQWAANILFGFAILFSWITIDDIVQHFIQATQRRKHNWHDLYSFWNWWPRSFIKEK